MITKKGLLAAALCLFSQVSVAGDQWVHGKVQILEEFGSYSSGAFQVLITLKEKEWVGAGNGATNCTLRFKLRLDDEGVTEEKKGRIFNMMLSAYMADKKVGLFVNTTGGSSCSVQIGKIGDGF